MASVPLIYYDAGGEDDPRTFRFHSGCSHTLSYSGILDFDTPLSQASIEILSGVWDVCQEPSSSASSSLPPVLSYSPALQSVVAEARA